MGTRHLIDGVIRATKSKTKNQCATKLGLDASTLHRIYERGGSMNLATFDLIQQKTGLPLDQLMAWYRMPEDSPAVA